jgi:hypothetical protein
MIRLAGLLVAAVVGLAPSDAPNKVAHPWAFTSAETLEARAPAPAGFTRAAAPDASFGAFLRTLPMAPADAKVKDFRGTPLYDDGRHENIAAVVDRASRACRRREPRRSALR